MRIYVYLILMCSLYIPNLVFGIEPISTLGQPTPEKHAFLTDNTLLRTSHHSTNIKIIDRDTREIIDEFGFRPKHSHVIFSPNASHVAILEDISDSNITKVTIWDVKTRELVSEWNTLFRIVDNSEFNPIHPWLVVSNNKQIQVWNWSTGELIGDMIGERRPWKKCSSDEITPEIGKSISKTCSNRPYDHDFEITPDGQYLFVASTRPDIEVWNLETRQLIGHFEGNASNWVTGIAVSSNGKHLASFERHTNIVYLYDIDTRQLIWKEQIDENRITDIEFSPDSKHLYVAHHNVNIFDVKSGQHVDTFGNDNWQLHQMLISPNGQIMLLQYGGSYFQGVVELWNTDTKQMSNVFADYFGGLPKISSDGKTLISIESFFIKIWDIPTQQVRFIIPGVYHFEKGVAISPDSKRIAYSKYPSFEIANIQNGEVEIQTEDQFDSLQDVEFSPSGRWLAWVKPFGYLSVWDLINPRKMHRTDIENPIERHYFKKVTFSENDIYLAATAVTEKHVNDKYWILVWKLEGEKYKLIHRQETTEHDDTSYSTLTFATLTDGSTVLANAGKTGTQIWRLSPQTIQLVNTLSWANAPIHFGHNKRYLFTNQGSALQIWDWKNSRPIKLPSTPQYQGLSRDGSYFISIDEIGRFQIWDAKALFSTLPYSVEPKGKMLVTLGQIKRNQLLQNYPNPFNPETWIPFKLAEDSPITIDIFNSTGELVRTISQGTMQAGDYSSQSDAVHWNGKNNDGESVSSGIYFYTINAGDFSATRKMLIRK